MAWCVDFTRTAEKQMRKLNHQTQSRIIEFDRKFSLSANLCTRILLAKNLFCAGVEPFHEFVRGTVASPWSFYIKKALGVLREPLCEYKQP